jgi:AhpD family alkylhydroperoxidase
MSKQAQNQPLETLESTPEEMTAEVAQGNIQEADVKNTVVELNNNNYGILGPMLTFPQVAKVLNNLAQCLLVDDHPNVTLTRAERELIAGQVSMINETEFCLNSHMSAAVFAYGGEEKLMEAVKEGSKIESLVKLGITTAITSQASATVDYAKEAKERGATNEDIHLTVAIAAAFCMFNRYVDVVGNPGPNSKEAYDVIGKTLIEKGYNLENFA